MNKRIVTFSFFILFLITFFQITGPVFADLKQNPEVVDECPDTIFRYIDIESAWFSEDIQQPSYLFVSMEIRNLILSSLLGGLYQVQWEYDNIDYAAFIAIGFLGSGLPKGFRAGEYGIGSNDDIFNMPECKGLIDEVTGIISWKIPKINLGNIKAGDVLFRPWAKSCFSGHFGFLSFIRLIPILGKDLAPTYTDENGISGFEYGLSYTIKY